MDRKKRIQLLQAKNIQILTKKAKTEDNVDISKQKYISSTIEKYNTNDKYTKAKPNNNNNNHHHHHQQYESIDSTSSSQDSQITEVSLETLNHLFMNVDDKQEEDDSYLEIVKASSNEGSKPPNKLFIDIVDEDETDQKATAVYTTDDVIYTIDRNFIEDNYDSIENELKVIHLYYLYFSKAYKDHKLTVKYDLTNPGGMNKINQNSKMCSEDTLDKVFKFFLLKRTFPNENTFHIPLQQYLCSVNSLFENNSLLDEFLDEMVSIVFEHKQLTKYKTNIKFDQEAKVALIALVDMNSKESYISKTDVFYGTQIDVLKQRLHQNRKIIKKIGDVDKILLFVDELIDAMTKKLLLEEDSPYFRWLKNKFCGWLFIAKFGLKIAKKTKDLIRRKKDHPESFLIFLPIYSYVGSDSGQKIYNDIKRVSIRNKGEHFTLLTIKIDLKESNFKFYHIDSLSRNKNCPLIDEANKILSFSLDQFTTFKRKDRENTTRFINLKWQSDGHNCGFFVCLFLLLIISKNQYLELLARLPNFDLKKEFLFSRTKIMVNLIEKFNRIDK